MPDFRECRSANAGKPDEGKDQQKSLPKACELAHPTPQGASADPDRYLE